MLYCPSVELRDFLRRVRQNHALKHATLNVLEERYPRLRAGGRATAEGFYLIGELPDAETVRAAAEQALARMRCGESALAIHPRCGTNLVATSFASGVLALALARSSGRGAPFWAQMPSALLGAMLGALLAQPLGPWLQANVTTSADVSDVQVADIQAQMRGRWRLYFVRTVRSARL